MYSRKKHGNSKLHKHFKSENINFDVMGEYTLFAESHQEHTLGLGCSLVVQHWT
jgi:hypothetical protein